MSWFKTKGRRIEELEKEVMILKARLRVTDVFLSEVRESLKEMKKAEKKEVTAKEIDELIKILFGELPPK